MTITERGTAGWELVVPGRAINKAIGDKTISPLLRLGLLEPMPDDPKCLVVSECGKKTCETFCQRGGDTPRSRRAIARIGACGSAIFLPRSAPLDLQFASEP